MKSYQELTTLSAVDEAGHSKLSSGCDYALFQDGMGPRWEDGRNRRGGRWLVSLAKQQRRSELDQLWLDTLLCPTGQSSGERGNRVCGAIVGIHANRDKVAVWTREAGNQKSSCNIGRVYKEHLGLSAKTITGYQTHADTVTKSSSLAKNKLAEGGEGALAPLLFKWDSFLLLRWGARLGA
nr:eukaryotic translation initiation factor 4E type 1B-like [Microcebus murinus]